MILSASGGEDVDYSREMLQASVQGRIGEVSTASVATGVLGVGGNKGAVAVSFTLCRRRFACVCSHFAAHQVHPAYQQW